MNRLEIKSLDGNWENLNIISIIINNIMIIVILKLLNNKIEIKGKINFIKS